MPDLELYCKDCGGLLVRLPYPADCSPCYKCRLCNNTGQLSMNDNGTIIARHGPALDPNYNTHRLIADGGTNTKKARGEFHERRQNQHAKNVLKQLRQAEQETRNSGDDELADRLGARYDELSDECLSDLRDLETGGDDV